MSIMQFIFNHTNLNVTNLEKSLAFYKEALGLTPVREKEAADGSFRLVFLSDGVTDYKLELTWLRDHEGTYELGENETHICFHVEDYEAAHEKHQQMGCICYENTKMGLYFIEDPDGYWFEIVPASR
jgi:lactoylglutathione lyase